ncbi:MAG: DUF2306 domain-containing protein [Bacteroidia bacterium]|nr:DUF2306 domain-containing protein [Bacteroidia bacterium]
MLSENIIQILIYIHAAAGGIALFTGPASFIAKKGQKWHRIFGKLFFYSMMVVSILALVISISPGHESLFLFSIGIFSAYLVCSGYRVLYLKSLSRNGKAQLIDWIISSIMLVFGLVMIVHGIQTILKNNMGGIVLLVFAIIALNLSVTDFRLYTKKTEDKSFWLFNHIGKMNGAVIAAYTAFIVVNDVLPGLLAWLGPIVPGFFVGYYFSNKYKKAITKNKKEPKEVVKIEID